MKRHHATSESIAKLRADRQKLKQARASKAPENAGLTKSAMRSALMGISESEYTVPENLIPSVPS